MSTSKNETQITCPHCGESFDVEAALSSKIHQHFQKEFEQKSSELTKKLNDDKQKVTEERRKLEQEKQDLDARLELALKEKLAEETLKIQQNAEQSVEAKLALLQEENEKQQLNNKAYKEKELEWLRKERDLKEQQDNLKLSLEKELLEKQSAIEDKVKKQAEEKFSLERLALQKQIDDNKKLAEEMKRKAEQGSMQLQGEVQELALEQLLQESFPFDVISEVPKGVQGADCIQIVRNSAQTECGSIVYESKRTKNFAKDWIEKFKQDQIRAKADIAILVTEVMPPDMDKFGEKDGVWICQFNEVKSLAMVLRDSLIKINAVSISQVNKGDKMELLYQYLTSAEFVNTIKRIVENYDQMQVQLNKEKKAMQTNWATREKQIWAVQESITGLFGSIKGIAGNSLETSGVLELENTSTDEH